MNRRIIQQSRWCVSMLLPALCAFLSDGRSYGEALQWKPFGSHRLARVPESARHAPGFTRLHSQETGLSFTNSLSPARQMANANLMNGSGVALGDYDGDGLCDIYFCDLSGTNALFRNLGNWRFTNVTDQAGVACPKQTSTGAVFADVNGDGKLDLLVTSMGGPHACFINLGNGRFTNTIATAGFTSRFGATSMALADVDGNGTLDLYVANYGVTSILRSGGALNVSYEKGKPVVRGRYAQRVKIIDGMMWELGEPDALYLNDGRGNFRQVSWTDGTFLKADGTPFKDSEIPWDQGLSVIMRDLNGDGAPDIYVANDAFTPDRFWINDGKGHFRELPHRLWRSISHFSMGVDVADIDRDGRDDIFVVDMLARERRNFMTQRGTMPVQLVAPGDIDHQVQLRRNTLLHNRGGLDFEEIAFYSKVADSDWSWSGLFLDVDLDGWEDILVTNGFEQNADDMDMQEKVRAMGQLTVEQSRKTQLLYPKLKTPNVAFRNRHDLTFEEVGHLWGFDATDISQGMAFADLDNDGDLDVVVSVYNGEALIYRNDGSAPRLGVKLKGLAPNTEGIGAKISVEGGPVKQTQEMICGGRYVSGDAAMRVFACGSPTASMAIRVEWPSGKVSTVDKVPANSVVEIREADARPAEPSRKATVTPLFADASNLLGHQHQEPNFDDFSLQPSLSRKLSQAGPGVVCADVTGDGFDDVVIGTGLNGSVALFRNTADGQFKKLAAPFGKEETGGIIAWKNEQGEAELLVSVDNYERRSNHSLEVVTLDATGSVRGATNFPGATGSGPLAICEVDGQVYLFQGCRFVPGAYPAPASSFLYTRSNGVWVRSRQNEAVLNTLGLVNAAVWSDLDADGRSELIVAGEWAPIRVFTLTNGKLVETTGRWGLESATGLWQSVIAADVDHDGRMDLVAGNWGLNNAYVRPARPGVELFYGSFDVAGRVDMVEAYFDERLKKTVPWRDKRILASFWPSLNERFPTHAQFAEVAAADLFAGKEAKHLAASILAHSVFLNRGDHFERIDLPTAAQFAPVFGINVADFDGDGLDDLFLAQNFSAIRDLESPLDSGRGLLLRGSPKGPFVPVPEEESGLQIFGDQRGSATADFDHDGRVDLVVSQNGAETKLYLNKTGRPGMRIAFRGGAGNPLAAGAQYRLSSGAGWGPLHDIQVGSGYWSQDSNIKVIHFASAPAKIQVRWPGGKTAEFDLPADAKQLELSPDSGVKRVH